MDINVEQEQTQTQDVPVHASSGPKGHIPTRFGSLIILLTAVIAGAGTWWYSFSYEPQQELTNVDQLVAQLKMRRAVAETATTTMTGAEEGAAMTEEASTTDEVLPPLERTGDTEDDGVVSSEETL